VKKTPGLLIGHLARHLSARHFSKSRTSKRTRIPRIQSHQLHLNIDNWPSLSLWRYGNRSRDSLRLNCRPDGPRAFRPRLGYSRDCVLVHQECPNWGRASTFRERSLVRLYTLLERGPPCDWASVPMSKALVCCDAMVLSAVAMSEHTRHPEGSVPCHCSCTSR
jgi:hypothetical protein